MQHEKIESLLMDHAMGAANEDVAALVEAYVEKDAEARETLAELRRTVGMAQRAIAQRPMTLPPFPRATLERTARRAAFSRRLIIAGAMAACVVMGAWAGWLFSAGSREHVVVVQVEKPPMQAGGRPAEVATVQDFWSVQRLRETLKETSKPPTGAPAIGWQDRMNFGRSSGGGL